MGMTLMTLKSFWEVIPEKDIPGKRIVELGDQEFFLKEKMEWEGIEIKLAKNYFELLGACHTSIDINGKNGALPLDFSQHLPITHRYDIVTNFGFSEHIGDQYRAWQNIDSLAKLGGYVICELPGEQDFEHHQHCPYYTTGFFERLCEAMKYRVIINRYQYHDWPSRGRVVFVAFQKRRMRHFMVREEFEKLPIGRNIGSNLL